MKRRWQTNPPDGINKDLLCNVADATLCCEADAIALREAIRELEDSNGNRDDTYQQSYVLVFPTSETTDAMSMLSDCGSDGKFLLNSFAGSDCILRKTLYTHLVQEMLFSLDMADVSVHTGKTATDLYCVSMLKACVHQLATNTVEKLVDETGLGDTFIAACRYSITYNLVPLRRKRLCRTRRSTSESHIFDSAWNNSASVREKLGKIVDQFKKTSLTYEVVDSRRLVLLYNVNKHEFHAIDLDDYLVAADGSCRKKKNSCQVEISRGLWHWDQPRFNCLTGKLSFNSPTQLVCDDVRRYRMQRHMKDKADAANNISCKVVVDVKTTDEEAAKNEKIKRETDDEVIRALESAKNVAYLKTRRFNENMRMLIKNDHDTTELLNTVARFDPVDEAMKELLARRRCQLRRPETVATVETRDGQFDAILNRWSDATGTRVGPSSDQFRLPMNPAFVNPDVALDRNAHAKHAKNNLLSAADLLRNALASLECTTVENEEFKKRVAIYDTDFGKQKRESEMLSRDNVMLKRLLARSSNDSSSSSSSSVGQATYHGDNMDDEYSNETPTSRSAAKDLACLQRDAATFGVIKIGDTERFCNASLKADAPDDEKTAGNLSDLFTMLATHLFGLRRTHDATGNILDWYVNPDMEAVMRGFIRKYTSITQVCPSITTNSCQISIIERVFNDSPVGQYIAAVMAQDETLTI